MLLPVLLKKNTENKEIEQKRSKPTERKTAKETKQALPSVGRAGIRIENQSSLGR